MANMQSQPFSIIGLLLSIHTSLKFYDTAMILRLFLGGFFAFLYLRQYFDKHPSLMGSISFMLSGYFIFYLNMPEISVGILTPALFYSIDRLIEEKNRKYFSLLSVTVCFIIFGGMPEVSFLVLAFGSIYMLVMIATAPLQSKGQKGSTFLLLFGSIFLGVMLSAVQGLPFYEYMNSSFNLHNPLLAQQYIGLSYDTQFLEQFLIYLLPLSLGTFGHQLISQNNININYVGYFGLTPIILGFFSVLFIINKTKKVFFAKFKGDELSTSAKLYDKDRVSIFFFFVFLVLILKRFGFSGVNWVGSLPFFRMIIFPKYEGPLLAFSVSVIFVYGLTEILNKNMRRVVFYSFFSVIFFLLAEYAYFIISEIGPENKEITIFYSNMLFGLSILSIFFATLTLYFNDKIKRPLVEVLLMSLLITELFFNFIFPVIYIASSLPSSRENPYKGSKYIKFIGKNKDKNTRVFGFDSVLYPDWSGVFGFQDLRDLDALYPSRYLKFVRNFILAKPDYPGYFSDSNLTDRFVGGEIGVSCLRLYNTKDLEYRLLALTSTELVLSMPAPTGSCSNDVSFKIFDFISNEIQKNKKIKQGFFSITSFKINGVSKKVFFQHPYHSDNTLAYERMIDKKHSFLLFDLGISPSVYNPSKGDGVGFRIRVEDPKNKIHNLFYKYIDPKNNPTDRKWFPERLDLSKYRGQTVKILFSTDPGPKGNNEYDWAGWGNIRWKSIERKGLSLTNIGISSIYNDEISIYKLSSFIPRAALYYNVEEVRNNKKSLEALRSNQFDIWKSVTICSCDIDKFTRSELMQLSPVDSRHSSFLSEQKILKYTPEDVSVLSISNKSGVLMLNDIVYPGWEVFVDNQRAKLIPVDYLFKGVFLKSGNHIVDFRYEPKSFFYGLTISCLSLFLLLNLSFWSFFRKKITKKNEWLT